MKTIRERSWMPKEMCCVLGARKSASLINIMDVFFTSNSMHVWDNMLYDELIMENEEIM